MEAVGFRVWSLKASGYGVSEFTVRGLGSGFVISIRAPAFYTSFRGCEP